MNTSKGLLYAVNGRIAPWVFSAALTAMAIGSCLHVDRATAQNDALAVIKKAFVQGNWESVTLLTREIHNNSQYALLASHMLVYTHLMEGRYNDSLREALQLKKRFAAGGRLSQLYLAWSLEYPRNEHVFLVLGDAYVQEGRNFHDAIKAFEKAREINDKNPRVYSMLGVAVRHNGQVDQAINLQLKAIELDRNFVMAYLNLSGAYISQKKFAEAKNVLRKAVEIRPDYALAWVNLGLVYRNLGSLDEAITCYQKTVSLAPDFPSGYLNLGAAYNYKGDYRKAREAWEKAVALDPDGSTGANARRNLSSLPR